MAWQPDYITSGDLKSYGRIGDAVDDPEIAVAITAASRAIDHACNRQFGATATTEERTYEVEWSPTRALWVADVDDVDTTTGLVVTVSGAAVTDYTLWPRDADKRGRPWTRLLTPTSTPSTLATGGGPPTIAVTATWGWAAVPDTIRQATLVQAARFLKRRESPFGIAGSPDLGNEMRLLARVDPDVAVMVQAYRRHHPFL